MATRIPVSRYWRLLSRYLRPQRRLLVLLAVLLLLGVLARIVGPLLASRFIDEVTADGPRPSLAALTWIAAAFCAAGIVDQVFLVAATHLGAYIGWTATNRLRTDLIEHSLTLDLEFHHENGPGQMIERIDGDSRELNKFLSEFAVSVVVNLVVIVGVLAVMVWYDWRIGLVYVGFAALGVYVFSRVRNAASPYWKANREAATALYGEAEERFGGLPDLRANGAEPYVRLRFVQALRLLFHRNRRALSTSVAISSGSELVLVLGATTVLGVAAALYLNGALTLGQVVSLVLFTQIINRPLEVIVQQMDELQRATASITRIEDMFAIEPTIVSGPGVAMPAGPPAVAFERVTFTYPRAARTGAPSALRDVSFALRPGEVMGLIGRTGSGKSTIARLLLRFYDPTAGRVLLGGTDLRQARLEDLRSHIGVVSQDVQLFNASIRDNLTMFSPAAPVARLEALLEEVGLGPWYGRQPAGLDTVLPPGGGGLSAGEAQLLAVVRIFVADPGLVILDEPTSRLDPRTEALVQRAFDRLLEGRTGVLVAHRLATLRRADSILVLERGEVVEQGPRTELELDPRSAYSQALRLSRGDGTLTASVVGER
jgi:ABC-type multidrug transport system fused ATPase/permease subunit